MKSRGGLLRLVKASRYTAQGLAAAFRHEAAFRQELLVGVPLLLAVACWAVVGWRVWAPG
jgi:diacylglycerol kinase (ATP)